MRILRTVHARRRGRGGPPYAAIAVAALALCLTPVLVGGRAPREEPARAGRWAMRWAGALAYAGAYRVRPGTAALIAEEARAAGLDPDLGFRLVRVESAFRPRATSPVGAIGLAQVMPATARYFDPDITAEQLYDERTNLRIGFRHLRGLVWRYNGDLRLALIAYNRGPVAVAASRRRGQDPSNGYDRLVLRGYTGPGVVR